MADEAPRVVEIRKVVVQYEVNGPAWQKAPAPLDPAYLERFVLAVLRKNQMQGSSL